MARHRGVRAAYWWLPAVALAALVAVIAVTLLRPGDANTSAPSTPPRPTTSTAPPAATCVVLRVVTATSFQPVLNTVAPGLLQGPDCVRLDLAVVDGRGDGGRRREEQRRRMDSRRRVLGVRRR